MANFEQFHAVPDITNGISANTIRTMAMVTMFGPAITGEAQALARDNKDLTDHEVTASAIHSAVSSILLREFPEATERHGIDHALQEFDEGYGMRDGFPTPTSWIYDGRDYYQVKADAIAKGRAHHREAMTNSRYTVTLGQTVGTLLPYMDTLDEQTKTMFDANFPHYLKRTFGNVWSMLLKQDSHVEHFSGIMDYIFLAADHGRPRAIPEPDEHDCFNMKFVMTEADVRRIFSEPIARAFDANMLENGTLKGESLRPSTV